MERVTQEESTPQVSHTPTPWKVGPLGDTVDDANGQELLTLYEADGEEEPAGLPYRANAEFIVRACNCHDELLAALKAIDAHWSAGNFSREPELWKQVTYAIQKAEGR